MFSYQDSLFTVLSEVVSCLSSCPFFALCRHLSLPEPEQRELHISYSTREKCKNIPALGQFHSSKDHIWGAAAFISLFISHSTGSGKSRSPAFSGLGFGVLACVSYYAALCLFSSCHTSAAHSFIFTMQWGWTQPSHPVFHSVTFAIVPWLSSSGSYSLLKYLVIWINIIMPPLGKE